MKTKLLNSMRVLLAAVLLGVGQSVWAYTETLTGDDATTKDNAIAKTSFTMLSTYNPSGSTTINSKSCLKVRWQRSDASTGNTNGFALKVNPGYMITKVEAQMSGNSSDLVLADIKVDGTSYAGSYSKTLKGSEQSTKYTNITLTGIAATNYINFEYSSGGSSQQGYVYMTVTYVKVNQWDFTDSGIWGSVALPTAESNTKNYQYNGVEGTSGTYVTFYSSDGSGLRHAKELTNGIGFSTTGSTSDHYVKMSVPGGYTAIVTANCTSNRNVKVNFDGVESPKFTDVASTQTQEFANDTEEAKDLYIYCTLNPDGNTKQPWLKKIVLKETVKVTTNFIDEEDNVIKTATVENVQVGSTYSTTYDATYYVSNTDPYKYTYVSGAASNVTINAATEYTVVYHKGDRASYTLDVTQSYGSKSQKLVNNQTVLEGASYTYYYPRFILDGTTLYEYASSTDPGASGSYWYGAISSMSANRDYTLTYNAKDGICVYYSEGEDVTGKSGEYVYSTWRNYMSNHSSGVFDKVSPTLENLGKGTYTITARVNGRASDRYIDFYKTSTSGDRILRAVSANNGKESSETFSLTENTDIVVNGGYVSSENGHGLDYVYIMKTGEVATIGDKGYATFSSTSPVDFTDVTNATAYIATDKSGDYIQMQSIEGSVAANTGLVLKSATGSSATVEIPFAASGTYYNTTTDPKNYLFAINSNYNLKAATDGEVNYVLSVQDEKVVWAPIGATDAPVTAGHAALWLPAEVAAQARALTMVFDDDLTGINSVKSEATLNNGAIYNLRGQRVAQPTKGLYIMGGKKVIVK